jgi:outer membrane protein TolC
VIDPFASNREGEEMLLFRACLLLAISAFLAAMAAPIPVAVAMEAVAPERADALWESGDASSATDATNRTQALRQDLPPGDREFSLVELVEVALGRQPTTRQAWYQARSSAAQVGVAESAWFPTLTLKGSGGPSHSTNPTYPGFSRINQISGGPGLSLTWLLLDFGSRSSAIEAARQTLFSSNFQFNKAIQDVIYNVIQGYYTFDSKGSLQESAVANVKLAESTLASVAQKRKAGLVSQTSVLQAAQNLAQAQYNLESAKGDLLNARASLMQSLGIPANAPLRVLPPPTKTDLVVLDRQVDELIAEALGRRPDVASKVSDFLGKKARARQASADIWPTVSLGSTAQRTFYDANVSTPPQNFSGSSHNNDYGATLTISMDIFDGLNKVNKARSARGEADAAKEGIAQAELAAITDVVTAYNAVQTAVRKVAAGQALLDASQKSFDSVQVSYKNGLDNLLNLLTAQDHLASARAQSIQSRNDLFLSSAQLTRSTGTLTPRSVIGEKAPPPAHLP